MCKWKMKLSAFMLTATLTAVCGLPAVAFADGDAAPEAANPGFSVEADRGGSDAQTNKPDGSAAGKEDAKENISGQGVTGETAPVPDSDKDAATETSPETEAPSVTGPDTDAPEATAPEATAPETTESDTTAPEATVPGSTEPDATAPSVTEPSGETPDSEVEKPADLTPATPAPVPEEEVISAPPAVEEVVEEEILSEDAALIVRHIITSDGKSYADEVTVSGLKAGDTVQTSDYARMSFKGVEYVDSEETVTLAAGKNVIELHYVLSEGFKIVEK